MREQPENSSTRIAATSAVLVGTFRDGLFFVCDGALQQELAHHSVRALAPDGQGGALAVVDGHSLCRRERSGGWSTIATAQVSLACCVAVGELV